jgi:hypothetical protein
MRQQAAGKPIRQPQWIVAGEIVETSQLFARTVAGLIRSGSTSRALLQVTPESTLELSAGNVGGNRDPYTVWCSAVSPAATSMPATPPASSSLSPQKTMPAIAAEAEDDRDDVRCSAVEEKKPELPPSIASWPTTAASKIENGARVRQYAWAIWIRRWPISTRHLTEVSRCSI